MDTKDTSNLLISVLMVGAVLGAFAIVGTYVYQVAANYPSNEKFALLAGTTIGTLLGLAKDAWKDWLTKLPVQK